MGVTNFRKEYHFRGIGENPKFDKARDFKFGINYDGQRIRKNEKIVTRLLRDVKLLIF